MGNLKKILQNLLELNKTQHTTLLSLCLSRWASLTSLSFSTHTHYRVALFRSKIFLDFNTVLISFLFNKKYLIIK